MIEFAGPVAVVAIAWATTNVRDTMEIANVALVLAAVTVGVALVGWRGGLVTSAAAALSLNYFHTEPAHSLRITDRSDLIAVLLLAVLGFAVSTATALRVRALTKATHEQIAHDSKAELRQSLTTGRAVSQVWEQAIRASCAELALVDCRLEIDDTSSLPEISRHRSNTAARSTFVLPETGAAVSFVDPRLASRVVFTPRHGVGPLELDRQTVTTFVDQLELALDADT